MYNRRLKLCLVGLGNWAKTGHLPVYAQKHLSPFVQVVALCSRNQEKAKEWAHKFGVEYAYTDYDLMLREQNPDIVAVCTPDHLHTSYVLSALEQGAHVLVEKPLALTTLECEQIILKAKASERKVIVLFHKRADGLWAEAASRIHTGKLGPMQFGLVSIQNSLRVSAGGYFQSNMVENSSPNWFLGTHMYDLLRFMTKENPIEVKAKQYWGELKARGIKTPDAIKADVTYRGGGNISYLLSWNLPEHTPTITRQEMILHFQKGELRLDGTQRGFYSNTAEGYHYINPYFLRESNGRWQGYGAAYMEEAIMVLSNGSYQPFTQLADAADGYWATALAEAVELSISNQSNQNIKSLNLDIK